MLNNTMLGQMLDRYAQGRGGGEISEKTVIVNASNPEKINFAKENKW